MCCNVYRPCEHSVRNFASAKAAYVQRKRNIKAGKVNNKRKRNFFLSLLAIPDMLPDRAAAKCSSGDASLAQRIPTPG